MVLLVLGVLTAGTGAVMIGFGVPINEFSLGNTLIISGVTALVGGLIVIALSVATRHLIRIASLLKTQPAPRRSSEGFDSPSSDGSGPSRMPFPPRPMQDPSRHPEARFTPPPAPPAQPNDPIFERLRNTPPPQLPLSTRNNEARNAEHPMLADEEAPLSPRAPRIPAEQPAAAEDSMLARMLRGGDEGRPAKPAEKARNGAASFPAAPAQQSRSSFNDVWPSEPAREEIKADPFEVRNEAPAPRHKEISRPADPFARHPEPQPAPAPRQNADAMRDAIMREERDAPVGILKSGVVDGMAYTLYTDGSIEAELAQGVVRFGSIEELRNHLEKSH
jgi:hypothetical protein